MRNEKEVIEMYENGKSPSEIASVLGVCRRSIYRLIKREKLELRKPKKGIVNREAGVCECCGKTFKQLQNKIRNKCNSCNTAIRRIRLKIKCLDYKGGICSHCGLKSEDISVYDFHHLDPKEKDFDLSITSIASKSWEEVKTELDKCILLCSNCHRIEHSQYKRFIKYYKK
jgi:predicted DNA-binding protein YlxM (UPF0122 family)